MTPGIAEVAQILTLLSIVAACSGLVVHDDDLAMILKTQRTALTSFFTATNGPQWSDLCNNGWTWDNQTTCEWFGITCMNNLVTSINLANCGLSGTLPSELGQVAYLQDLDVSSNAISGTIPDNGLLNLTNLQLVYLYNNNFSGTLPVGWSAMSSLTDVRLFNNSFTGTLPTSWSVLSYLSTLWLSGNRLSGSLPDAYSALTQLSLFDISQNGNIVGTLPSSWSSITNLGTVGLQGNQFVGTLPDSWGNLSSLSSLQVDDNHLTGSLPNRWGAQMSNLWQFTASNNNLTGTLPESWSQLLFLGSFNVSHNQLSGNLPSTWPAAMNSSMIADALDIRWNCVNITITNVTDGYFWANQWIAPQRQGQC